MPAYQSGKFYSVKMPNKAPGVIKITRVVTDDLGVWVHFDVVSGLGWVPGRTGVFMHNSPFSKCLFDDIEIINTTDEDIEETVELNDFLVQYRRYL